MRLAGHGSPAPAVTGTALKTATSARVAACPSRDDVDPGHRGGVELLAGRLYSHFRSKPEILAVVIDPFDDRLLTTQEVVIARRRDAAARQRGPGRDGALQQPHARPVA